MITKKQTILIAAMINAGLLMLLCIVALSSEEEVAAELPSLAIQSHEEEVIPFFSEQKSLPVSEVVHALPPLVLPQGAPLPVPIPVLTPPPPPAPPVAAIQEVVVRSGDTLEKLAKIYKISVDDLIKFNHLPSTFLRVGQVLRIPSGNGSTSGAATLPEAQVGEYYLVRAGDSPWTIAMKHHMKVDELLKLNGLDEGKARKLKPGDRIRIR